MTNTPYSEFEYREVLRPLGELTDQKIHDLHQDVKRRLVSYQCKFLLPIFQAALLPDQYSFVFGHGYHEAPYEDPKTHVHYYARPEHDRDLSDTKSLLLRNRSDINKIRVEDIAKNTQLKSKRKRLVRRGKLTREELVKQEIEVTLEAMRINSRDLIERSFMSSFQPVEFWRHYTLNYRLTTLHLAFLHYNRLGHVDWTRFEDNLSILPPYTSWEKDTLEQIKKWWQDTDLPII